MRIFKEEQRFTQTWLVVVMLMSTLVPFGIIINEFTKEKSTMTINELFLVMTIMLVAVVPIFFFKEESHPSGDIRKWSKPHPQC